MVNTLRCCIACILPCGALDVVRVLHADGRVEEYGGRVTAGEVMKANPKYVLAQPICEAIVKQKPSFLHPDTELRKGKIYLLVPTYTLRKDTKAKLKKTSRDIATERPTHEKQLPTSCMPQLPKAKPEIGRQVRVNKQLPVPQRSVKCSKRGGTTWKPILECIMEIEEDV